MEMSVHIDNQQFPLGIIKHSYQIFEVHTVVVTCACTALYPVSALKTTHLFDYTV